MIASIILSYQVLLWHWIKMAAYVCSEVQFSFLQWCYFCSGIPGSCQQWDESTGCSCWNNFYPEVNLKSQQRLLSGEELRCPSAAMEKVLSYFCSDEAGREYVVVHNQMTVCHLRCCSEQLGRTHGFDIHRVQWLQRWTVQERLEVNNWQFTLCCENVWFPACPCIWIK